MSARCDSCATRDVTWGGWPTCRAPEYADGSPVLPGDRIRYRQAPGGLLPRSETWREGTAEPLAGHGCDRELYLRDDQDGRHYMIFSHEIERLEVAA